MKEEGFIKLDRRKGAIVCLDFSESKEKIKESIKKELTVTMAEAYCKKISKVEITVLIDEIYGAFLKTKESPL